MSRRTNNISTKPVKFSDHSRRPFWQTLVGIFLGFILINLITLGVSYIQKDIYLKKGAERDVALTEIKSENERITKAHYLEATKPIDDANCSPSDKYSDPTKISVLVNKRRCARPLNFLPKDISEVDGVPVSSKIAKDLQAMLLAARASDVNIKISSGFRTYEQQSVACEEWVVSLGSQLAADKNCARPGYSEHQTGFSVDFISGGCVLECIRTSDAYAWLEKHGAEYGFIERYPLGKEAITGYRAEAWHYRYIGPSDAQYMKANGIKTLEEYYKMPGPGLTPKVPGYEI